ncbi:hypothetical protein [Azorhizobium oxalatiphilum]|uniref:hypothetical protein n=1 Tax=Azorhizobium oxalatiphilum TaxID=980631 RepID=UPI00166360A7|nr:hypothetical protein [Azorhizobium oxalatiphilum]
MIRIEIDTFSGRHNPSWELPDEQARALLAEFTAGRSALSTAPGPSRLGFRGLEVQIGDSARAKDYGLPHIFRIGDGQATDPDASRAIARRLLTAAPVLDGHPAVALEELAEIPFMPATDAGATDSKPQPGDTPLGTLEGEPDDEPEDDMRNALDEIAPGADVRNADLRQLRVAGCRAEIGPFMPDYWNDPNVIRRNNCYAYACNRRTDTRPQPGQINGMTLYDTLASTTLNAMVDGARTTSDCCSILEKPRWLVALVTYPDNARHWDYHWYRRLTRGRWGHKPGRTRATMYDNAGHLITDPQTCSRGRYTQFGGYFYIPRSMTIA